MPVQRMPELHLDLDAYENPFNPPAKASEEGMDTGLEVSQVVLQGVPCIIHYTWSKSNILLLTSEGRH